MQTLDSVLTLPVSHAPRAQFERGALRFRKMLVRAGNRCIEALLAWQRRAVDRACLAAMDERQLRDVGLARSAVLVEADKPFWRA